MEPYIIEILLNGKNEVFLVYSIQSEETNDHLLYEVYQEGRKIGTMYPYINHLLETSWFTYDLMSQEMVDEIGKKICDKDL